MAVNVMIVEDDPVTLAVLQKRLQAIGCDIAATADNAADALAKFRETKPDLVTLDIQLPEIGGVDVVELFQTMRKESYDTEIVVISGTAFPRYREIFRSGVIGFFQKPLHFDEVASLLRKYFPELKPYKGDRAF
ncbi:MAG: response regulator [Candidatus Binataceae bacterium]|jgi:two-component system chemotaxis response regulator CheY